MPQDFFYNNYKEMTLKHVQPLNIVHILQDFHIWKPGGSISEQRSALI